jgi:hypothetical protein
MAMSGHVILEVQRWLYNHMWCPPMTLVRRCGWLFTPLLLDFINLLGRHAYSKINPLDMLHLQLTCSHGPSGWWADPMYCPPFGDCDRSAPEVPLPGSTHSCIATLLLLLAVAAARLSFRSYVWYGCTRDRWPVCMSMLQAAFNKAS